MNRKHLKIIHSLDALADPEDPFAPLMANPPPKKTWASVTSDIRKTNQLSRSISLQDLDGLIQWLKTNNLLPNTP